MCASLALNSEMPFNPQQGAICSIARECGSHLLLPAGFVYAHHGIYDSSDRHRRSNSLRRLTERSSLVGTAFGVFNSSRSTKCRWWYTYSGPKIHAVLDNIAETVETSVILLHFNSIVGASLLLTRNFSSIKLVIECHLRYQSSCSFNSIPRWSRTCGWDLLNFHARMQWRWKSQAHIQMLDIIFTS